MRFSLILTCLMISSSAFAICEKEYKRFKEMEFSLKEAEDARKMFGNAPWSPAGMVGDLALGHSIEKQRKQVETAKAQYDRCIEDHEKYVREQRELSEKVARALKKREEERKEKLRREKEWEKKNGWKAK